MTQRTRYFMIGSALVLVLGLGVGLFAYYNGGLPLGSRSGPAEFAYIPADASAVAYADVRTIMDSEFRQKLRQVLPSGEEKDKLHAETGIDLERDIDTVVAGALGPEPTQTGLVMVRGRFNQSHIEALTAQHGMTAEDYRGKKLMTHGTKAIAFLEPGLLALGEAAALRRAIDTSQGQDNITKNGELMKLVADVQSGSHAWVVGNFEAISKSAPIPTEVRAHIPAVQWFAASANVNGGLNGVVRAEARDEKAGEELRAVVTGIIAAGRLVSGKDQRAEALLNSLQVTGAGKSVAVSFTVPAEILDIINGLAAAKHLTDHPKDHSPKNEAPKR